MTQENMFAEMQEKTNSADSQDDANVAEVIQQVSEEQAPVDSVFDYTQLPDTPGQKYDRVNLEGQTVTVKSAVIKQPFKNDWEFSKDKKTKMKSYQFIVSYDTENKDHENYSGIRGFEQQDGSLGMPCVQTNKTKTQASKLFDVYRKYIIKTKNITVDVFNDTYGLKQFMAFLNSKPKAKIEIVEAEWEDNITKKNTIVEFL